MKPTKHTQGPWETVLQKRGNTEVPIVYCLVHPTAPAICELVRRQHKGEPTRDADEVYANACLIAAAPECLDFIKSIEDRVTLIRAAFKAGDRAQLEQLILDMDADAFDLINKATGGAE